MSTFLNPSYNISYAINYFKFYSFKTYEIILDLLNKEINYIHIQ